MGKLKELGRAAVAYSSVKATELKEKNHRAARMNRLRLVCKCEEQAAEKEYLALGRYYYNALRNKDDAIAEAHCARIDQIQERRDTALEELERLAKEAEANKSSSSIGIIGGADGPTAVFVTGKLKGKRSLFHFERGTGPNSIPNENTDDEGTEEIEEIDLSDVESFDSDPIPEELAVEPAPLPPIPEAPAAEADFPAPIEPDTVPIDMERIPVAEPEALPPTELEPLPPAEPEILPPAEPEILPAAELEILPAAELDENDGLPFEG